MKKAGKICDADIAAYCGLSEIEVAEI